MCDYSAADVGWLEDDCVGAVAGHLGRQIARVGIGNGDEVPVVSEQLAIRRPAAQPVAAAAPDPDPRDASFPLWRQQTSCVPDLGHALQVAGVGVTARLGDDVELQLGVDRGGIRLAHVERHPAGK